MAFDSFANEIETALRAYGETASADVDVEIVTLRDVGLTERVMLHVPTERVAEVCGALNEEFFAYEIASHAGYILVASAPSNGEEDTPELAAKRKGKMKKVIDGDGDDANLPPLKVIHDAAGFKMIQKLFSNYVGADEDYRHVMLFMKDVDDLLVKYRLNFGHGAKRPLTESRMEVNGEPTDGQPTRVDHRRAVDAATKKLQKEAPGGDEVASVIPEDQDIAAPETASVAPEVPLVLAPVDTVTGAE